VPKLTEAHEHRLKRLKMRSMRRGIKEMDLILERYADNNLPRMDAARLDHYEALLDESDHDLYQWVTEQVVAPAPYGDLIADIISQLPKTTA
jgi:antitoxin CptB